MSHAEDNDAAGLDVLAFGAHPDDVELLIGGTIARLVGQGHRVGIVDLTRGELGTRGTPELRAEEAAEAARILGVAHRANLDLGDGHLVDDLASRGRVVEAIREHRPQLILTHTDRDRHPDHEAAGKIVRAASFLSGLRNFDPGRQPHRAQTILGYFSHTMDAPDLVIDVSQTFEKKREACLAYRSQFHDPDSSEPRTFISRAEFWDWWEARARHYGQMINATHGEAFTHEGPIPVDDPVRQFGGVNYYPNA